MPAKTQTQPAGAGRGPASLPIYQTEGLSPKKTALIIVIVIGCIAILWPKVFYPMMFGGVAPKANGNVPEQRGTGGCCGVMLDRQEYLNSTLQAYGPQAYHKQLNLHTGESIRQERPAHLHPESIYQAMRERGRAIPATPTIPIVERKSSPSNPPPRIVEGRPGPIPGMRPPMGAGSVHQPQAKGSSMGFILPLYTIGIIVFFGYTIMKLVFKKPIPNAPYGPAPMDPNFRKEVFGHENGRHVEDLNSSKLGTNLPHADKSAIASVAAATKRNATELYNASLSAVTAASNLSTSIKQHQLQHHSQPDEFLNATVQRFAGDFQRRENDQLMEIEKLRRKLEETEKSMAKIIAEMNSDQFDAKTQKSKDSTPSNVENISNGHTTSADEPIDEIQTNDVEQDITKQEIKDEVVQRKRRETSTDRSVAVLGMEVTVSCEGGQKWPKRDPSSHYYSHNRHSKNAHEMPEPQSIYLEGALAHESQILVADAETKTEEVYDEELNGSEEEPAVVLSSKMTLSLISLDAPTSTTKVGDTTKNEIESPLADDIEIIGHDEK